MIQKTSEKYTTWDELRNELFTEEERKESDAYVQFLGKLIEIRDNEKLTQKELSERAKVTQALISNIETRKQEPKINTVIKLLASMDYKLDIVPLEKNG